MHGTTNPVSTASGVCHTVTDTCRYRGRVGTSNSSTIEQFPDINKRYKVVSFGIVCVLSLHNLCVL